MNDAPDEQALLRRAWWRSVVQTAAGMTAVLLLTGGVVLLLVSTQQSAALDADLAVVLAEADDVGDPPPGTFLGHPRDDGTVEVTTGAPASVAALLSATALGSPGAPADRDVTLPGTGRYRVRLVDRTDGQRWVAASDLAVLRAEQRAVLQAVLLAEAAGLAGVLAVAALLSRRAVSPLARALQLQRRFVADASHELRAPLTVLHTRAQLLATDRTLDPGSPLGEGLHDLVADTRALGEVVEDLLVSAALDHDQRPRRPVDLDEVAAAVCRSMAGYADTQQVALTHHQDPGPGRPLVTGHPAALRRAVTALVDNAIGHTATGGHTEVRTTRLGEKVRLVVTDDGIGLDPAGAESLFTRSQTSSHGPRRHFGLGLALVREIAHAHGGSVTAHGRPGHGARFILLLPYAGETGAPPPDHLTGD